MNRLLAATFMWALSTEHLLSRRIDAPPSTRESGTLLVAVSRNDSTLHGGISSGTRTNQGTVAVEPIARITKSGKWQDLPCRADYTSMCSSFEREFLSRSHRYTVVSAEGQGAVIDAAPSTLGDCYEYTGAGTYAGREIANFAIAASSDVLFTRGPTVRLLSALKADSLRQAVVAGASGELGSGQTLEFLALSLEGHQLFVAQASYPRSGSEKLTFAIGALSHGSFHFLRRTLDSEGEEQVLGTIRLKSGREYLVTTLNDSESQIFRVYGILHGRIVLVYSGGGSSC